ncbi:MAG: V-type ATP synthase subunit D [Candidatus Woesearchaeota archaeon]
MNITPTRMELLKTRQRKKTAIKGYNLLKKKRDALIREFFILIKNYKELKQKTIEKLSQAYTTLQIGQGVSGANRVKGLSLSSEKSFSLKVSSSNLMGVKVPKLLFEKKTASFNASLIGVSYYVEDTRKKFLELMPDMVKLAEIELVIKELAEEIKKTKRRVNALEYVKIPEIKSQEKAISDRLSEMERESFIRLKNVKKKIQNN